VPSEPGQSITTEQQNADDASSVALGCSMGQPDKGAEEHSVDFDVTGMPWLLVVRRRWGNLHCCEVPMILQRSSIQRSIPLKNSRSWKVMNPMKTRYFRGPLILVFHKPVG
jgi:hypothetical protein